MTPSRTPSWDAELAAHREGYARVAGLDEAGRGPLAGPVVAACVLLPLGISLDGVADSKTLTPSARVSAFDAIRATALAIGIGKAEAAEIDSLNVLRATHLAMCRAYEACEPRPDFVLVDGLPVPSLPIRHQAIVKGDVTSMSIAAASVVAKVTRDRIMEQLDCDHPDYGFAQHKGYPTPEHLAALQRLGPSPEHRRSFEPVRRVLGQTTFFPQGETMPTLSGARGEALARLYLERIGHRIMETDYRCGRYQIDIVSLDDDTLVFVEVKTSSTYIADRSTDIVSHPQRRRIAQAARAFLANYGGTYRECRFDVIEVKLSGKAPRILHHKGAFDADIADW